nr:hypothetical protein [uncultured Cohaesibacter sp.]
MVDLFVLTVRTQTVEYDFQIPAPEVRIWLWNMADNVARRTHQKRNICS